ncbi:MAG: sigma-70 family RNA polymerase sigma factor [Planctomycetes bacterium]|nr:sigma-70 family RNA polymerase sigma factor [Planctomycetota bacterium]
MPTLALQLQTTRPLVLQWPKVAGELRQRSIAPEPGSAEDREGYENRIGTALMGLFRDGRDPQVFEALYGCTGPGVLLWIRSLLGRELSHLDPAELLQDTFVNVYRYPGAFREDHGGSFRVWVRTIAGNVVRRATMIRARMIRHDLEEAGELEDHGRGPIQAIQDEDESQRLRQAWVLLLWYYAQAWKELSQRDRRTLHLVEVEGLSYQEAGRVLSVGRSNMKMIVFRSRKRIARRIREAMSRGSMPAAPELVA